MEDRVKIPIGCLFKACYNPALEAEISRCKDQCHRYNQLSPNDREAQREILAALLGKMGEDVFITPPFWCDYGYHIILRLPLDPADYRDAMVEGLMQERVSQWLEENEIQTNEAFEQIDPADYRSKVLSLQSAVLQEVEAAEQQNEEAASSADQS